MRKWDLNGPAQRALDRGGSRFRPAAVRRPDPARRAPVRRDPARWRSACLARPSAFVQPASSTDGNGRPSSIPEGARIRLKRDVVLPKPRDPITGKLIKLTKAQQRMSDAIVACLRTYGAIVVDRAAVPTLYAQRNVTDTMIKGNELQGLTLNDFEVLPIGQTYHYPPEEDDVVLVSPSTSPSGQPRRAARRRRPARRPAR